MWSQNVHKTLWATDYVFPTFQLYDECGEGKVCTPKEVEGREWKPKCVGKYNCSL